MRKFRRAQRDNQKSAPRIGETQLAKELMRTAATIPLLQCLFWANQLAADDRCAGAEVAPTYPPMVHEGLCMVK